MQSPLAELALSRKLGVDSLQTFLPISTILRLYEISTHEIRKTVLFGFRQLIPKVKFPIHLLLKIFLVVMTYGLSDACSFCLLLTEYMQS